VGTAPGKDDLFPNSIVANGNVTSVALVDGYVHLEGETTNINIRDYANSNVTTPDNSTEAANATTRSVIMAFICRKLFVWCNENCNENKIVICYYRFVTGLV
jgi:hypothetical protein